MAVSTTHSVVPGFRCSVSLVRSGRGGRTGLDTATPAPRAHMLLRHFGILAGRGPRLLRGRPVLSGASNNMASGQVMVFRTRPAGPRRLVVPVARAGFAWLSREQVRDEQPSEPGCSGSAVSPAARSEGGDVLGDGDTCCSRWFPIPGLDAASPAGWFRVSPPGPPEREPRAALRATLGQLVCVDARDDGMGAGDRQPAAAFPAPRTLEWQVRIC